MDTFDIIVENQKISEIESGIFVKKPAYDFFKRVFDISCSLVALIILSPVFLIITLIILIDDFGNPFYLQKRTGYRGKIFTMIKFRSMVSSAEGKRNELLKSNEADGPIFKIENDPRLLRSGKRLRKYSLDELPNLINVLLGSMSIIGPRPLPVYEQNACNKYQNQRLLVKPGLSCYTALDKNSEKNFDNWIELDLKYIRERSFKTDLKIIFKTMGVVLKHKNY